MVKEKQYILAVPNFSNGRDEDVINAIVEEVRKVEGVKLISFEPEHDFNRTVVTCIGEPGPLKEAMLNMAAKSYELIDMREQEGTHPRIGAQDTIPLYPFKNIELVEVQELAEDIAKELYAKHEVPIFFSGVNSRDERRTALGYIRKGQYEGLRDLLKDTNNPDREERKPDISKDGMLSDTKGATIVSADNEGLTAFNVFLGTEDLSIAKQIGKAVRGPSGGFSTIRAVGLKFPEHTGVVVSMNMFDCGKTPIYRAINFVKSEAARYGVSVIGTELVGPVKLDYLLNSLEYYMGLEGFSKEQILEVHLMD